MDPAAAKIVEGIAVRFWKPRATVSPPSAADLQRRYLTVVLNYVAARIGIGAEAEDIAAEVFGAAFVSLRGCPRRPGSDSDDPVRAWLLGIARRKLADAYRRRRRRPEAALDATVCAPEGHGPEARALADEAARTLQAILDDLPEVQREALRLKYIEELSLVEIGQVLGRSPAAVGQLLHRARQAARTRGNTYFGDDTEDEGTSK